MTDSERKLEQWLSNMDEALASFLDGLSEIRDRLDFSGASLDVLEAWLLDKYTSIEAFEADSDGARLDEAARYIGETFLRTLGGRWWADPEGKAMGGWPLIGGHRSSRMADSPHSLATASLDRRTGTMISTVWRNKFRWIAGRAPKNPLIDDPNMRKHLKVWQEEKDFKAWLKRMDDELGYLMADLPDEVRERLDNSVESLDILERWLLDRYPDGDAARDETQVLTLDGVSRYIGQTFIAQLGGKWWFDLFGWSHNGLPQVTEFSADVTDPAPVCPLALALAAADVRTGDTWSAALRAKQRSGEHAA